MTTELGFLALTQLQKIDHSHPKSRDKNKQGVHQHQGASGTTSARAVVPPSMWIWNPHNSRTGQEDIHHHEEESSWEVKAFEEDITNLTWPPRSYSCSFCRREFRSAQALGGHMNIHRRLRPKLNPTNNNINNRGDTSTATIVAATTVINNACTVDPSPATLLFMPSYNSGGQGGCHVATTKKVAPLKILSFSNGKRKEMEMEMEIDLELRLWHRSPSSSTNS